MIPIGQIAAFCRVFELGSMTAASLALGLTQSAVSKQVSQLERSLGARLFDRKGPRLVPTAAASRLYPQAVAVVAAHSRFTAAAGPSAVSALRIAASNVPGQYLVPELWGEFSRDQVSWSQTTAIVNSREAIARLLAGTVDAAFVGAGPEGQSTVRFQAVARDRLVVIAPANRWREVDDLLSRGPWIWREQGSAIRQLAESFLRARGLSPQSLPSAGEYGSAAALVAAVRAGLGIGFTSLITVRGDSSVRTLDGHLDRDLFLALPPVEHTSPLAARFGQFCHDRTVRDGLLML